MAKSDPIPEAMWDKFMAFNRKLGYRFVFANLISPKAAPGEAIRLSVWIDNVGVAQSIALSIGAPLYAR